MCDVIQMVKMDVMICRGIGVMMFLSGYSYLCGNYKGGGIGSLINI